MTARTNGASSENPALAVALDCAALGWPVCALRPGTKVPDLVAGGWHAATTDAGTVRGWARRWPGCNFGLALAPAGLVALDVETLAGHGLDGAAALGELAELFGPLPPTVTTRTATGGRHYIYRAPESWEPHNAKAPWGELLGAQQVVLAGSTVPAGAYAWERSPADVGELPELPAWVADVAAAHKRQPGASSENGHGAGHDAAAPGERPTAAHGASRKANSRAAAYAAAALDGNAAELAAAHDGGRNAALNAAALALGALAAAYDAAGLECYSEADAWGALWAACQDTGLAADDGERQCRATFGSGWRAGRASPRALPDFDAYHGSVNIGGGKASDDDDAGSSEDDGADADGGKEAKPSQASRLVDLVLALGAELFHAPDGAAFATVTAADGRRHTMRVSGQGAFARWARHQYRIETGRVPSGQTVADACATLAGIAEFEGPEAPAFVRLAGHDGRIYLDLGGDDWRAVEVTPDGWRVVSDPPVRFHRPPGLTALPEPLRGGNVGELWRFLNVAPESRPLVLAWLVAALRPTGPYPVLVLGGEQGSGKSSTARALRGLVDANASPIRAEPREVRDLMIAAANSWAVTLDNLSHVQGWLSDALCRLATGGGWAIRANYADRDEVLFEAQRPVILNGIGELATRSDLLDRSLLVTLPTIGEDRRATEADLWAAYNERAPYILGALLDAVAAALAALPSTRLDKLPRMADFALWATAAEAGLGLAAGEFMDAYNANRTEANALALDGAPIYGPLRAVLRECEGRTFTGTAAGLLNQLNEQREGGRAPHGWPEGPRGLTSILTRLAPNLRAEGIYYTPARGKKVAGTVRRVLTIEWVREAPEQGPNGIGDSTVNTLNSVNRSSKTAPNDGEQPSTQPSTFGGNRQPNRQPDRQPAGAQPSTGGGQPSTFGGNRQPFSAPQKGAVDGVDGVDGLAGNPNTASDTAGPARREAFAEAGPALEAP